MKPTLHALVAKVNPASWDALPKIMQLADAYDWCMEHDGYCLLLDPHDEIALGTWEREGSQPIRKWLTGTSGD